MPKETHFPPFLPPSTLAHSHTLHTLPLPESVQSLPKFSEVTANPSCWLGIGALGLCSPKSPVTFEEISTVITPSSRRLGRGSFEGLGKDADSEAWYDRIPFSCLHLPVPQGPHL